MVSPLMALASVSRNDPGPLSSVLVTIRTRGISWSSSQRDGGDGQESDRPLIQPDPHGYSMDEKESLGKDGGRLKS